MAALDSAQLEELRPIITRMVERALSSKVDVEVPALVDEAVAQLISAEGRQLSEESLGTSMDSFYLLYAGSLVFIMQAGFAMLVSRGGVSASVPMLIHHHPTRSALALYVSAT